jgi:hypothetical protein
MKKGFLIQYQSVIFVSLIILNCLWISSAFAEGRYILENEGQYLADFEKQWVKAKCEAFSVDGINYVKCTVAKDDQNVNPDDDYQNTFRCSGHITVNHDNNFINLFPSKPFEHSTVHVSYEINASAVEIYFYPDEIVSEGETAAFMIFTRISGDIGTECPSIDLPIGPFTITHKDSKPTLPDEDEDPPVVIQEIPASPKLNPMGKSVASNQVEIGWHKVLDSHYQHNATHYIIEYSKNFKDWDDAISIDAGNPSISSNLYETLSYVITDLSDDTTYYFRVKGVNETGDGLWSNAQCVSVDIENRPYFINNNFYPDDGAAYVSKTVELKWKAFDPDNDSLDYYVTLGESANALRTVRAFRDSEHQGEKTFDIGNEYEPLKPGTTYYWQVWVREDGRNSDYYDGEYIKSPIRSFTTENTGADLAIIGVVQVGEIKPDSQVLFQVTVKNIGTESIEPQWITSSYIKSDKETPFYYGDARANNNLAPGEEENVNINVRFTDGILNKNGVEYDNVLIANDSAVKFFININNHQDIDLSNNSFVKDIHYESTGAPEVRYFALHEYGKYVYGDTNQIFWGRMGHDLAITAKVRDDIKVTRGVIEYRLHADSPWQLLLDQENNQDTFYFNYDNYYGESFIWTIPDNIEPTNDAQIRITFYDDTNESTTKISDSFSIYSNRIDTTIQTSESSYKVNNKLNYTINNDADYPVKWYRIDLFYGDKSIELKSDSSQNGIMLDSQHEWEISDNRFVSDFCFLRLKLEDIYGNVKEVRSSLFKIQANTELPSPFERSVILYDNEFQFPADAMSVNQSQSIQFIKSDQNNKIHTVVSHFIRYFKDTESEEYLEDELIYNNDKYYITYDQTQDVISPKIEICNKNYDVIDFAVVDNTPFALLKKPDQSVQYYYTYKEGARFVNPINIENPSVPEIDSISKIDEINVTSNYSEPCKYIFSNGYLWRLINIRRKITRYSFSEGILGDEESVYVTNSNDYNLSSDKIKPTTDGLFIYFIYPNRSELVSFNTSNLQVKTFDLPFEIGDDDREQQKISISAMNGKVFIFANGKVYSLQDSSIVELCNIQYTFNGILVDYSVNNRWDDDIDDIKALKTENEIVLMMEIGWNNYVQPELPHHREFLYFDINSYTFEKRIVQISDSIHNTFNSMMNANHDGLDDYQYIGDQKLLFIYTKPDNVNPYKYFSHLKLLDLETGAVNQIVLNNGLDDIHLASLMYVENTIYILGSDHFNLDSYRLSFRDKTLKTKQVEDMQFLKKGNNLYTSWYRGNTYDGRWDEQNDKLSNIIQNRNRCRLVYPNIGTIQNVYQEFISCGHINVSNNYLSFPRQGKIVSVNQGITANELVYDENYFYSIAVKTFTSDIITAFANDYENIYLINNNFSPSIVIKELLSEDNIIGIYNDEAIIVGDGKDGEYNNKFVITKHDFNTKHNSSIVVDHYVNSYNIQKVDINQNKYVAVAWDNYIAVADFSGDVVPPTISITPGKQKIATGETVTLNWQASDNKDELIRYEIYKNNTLVHTITDTITTSYEETVNETGGNITYKIKAVDHDGNIGYDTVEYIVFTPASFNSFTVNKTRLELGEKLIFTWDAANANESTSYSVYKKKSDASDWEHYFNITGATDYPILVDGFIGEYQFMIGADGNFMALSETVHIDGEIIEFNPTDFSNESLKYFLELPEINLTWGIDGNLSDIVSYDLYVKHGGEPQFQKIATTTDCHYYYQIPENVSKEFEWKIQAQFRGDTYNSQIMQTRLQHLDSPDVSSVQLLGNNTLAPSTVITFTPAENIEQYAIMRRDNEGNYLQIGQSQSGIYTDTTIDYDKQYEYAVCSITDQLVGDPGASKSIDITIKPVRWILIENPSHTILESNAITIHYFPDSDDCFERYEIWTGSHIDTLQPYTITQQRSITFDALEYGDYTYVQIFAVNHQNERVTWQPAQVSFERPYNESHIDIKVTNINSSKAVISWVTTTQSTGMVRYGTDPDNKQDWQTQTDTRGEDVTDELHYVSLQSLDSDTTYHFEVISGSMLDNNNGDYYRLTTGPALSPKIDSCQVSGKIFSDAEKTIPIENAIVYVTILGQENSSTRSLLLTPESNGRWWMERINFRTVDHQQYYTDCCEERNILIEVVAGNEISDRLITTATLYDPEISGNDIQDLVPEQNHTIHISSGDNGSITPTGHLNLGHHTDMTVQIMPDDGYHIESLFVDGQPVEIISTYTFHSIAENHSISAAFAKNIFTIQSQAGPGGQIIAQSSVKYSDNCHISILENTGYHIFDLRINGTSQGAIKSYTLTNIQQNYEITATFEINTYSITTITGPDGTISPSSTVTHGSNYTVTILPDEGFYIFNVIIDGESIGQKGVYIFEDISKSHEIIVEFQQYRYAIDASALMGGSITNNGNTTVLWGESIAYTIQANDGFILYDVLVDNVSNGPLSTYQFPNVQQDHTIQAIFAAEYHLYPGYNIVSLTFEPETPLNAMTWAEEINNNGGRVKRIQHYINGDWSTYNAGAPFNYFNIEMGHGYALYCEQESIWMNAGQQWKGKPYLYQNGFNLFGFPLEQSLMASELAQMINQDQVVMEKILQWTGGGFAPYSINAPFTDYSLSHLKGYFLFFNDSGEFEINP